MIIYRLPNGNFFSESRSYCPACKKQLGWRDLIPIISFVLLKGRCRYCGAGIPLREPLVEIIGAVLIILCFMRYGLDVKVYLSFCILMILLAITFIDIDIMEIPNSLVLSLIPLSICAIWAWPNVLLTQRLIGFFVISLPLLLITLTIPEAFGGGDIKLMAVCGFLLGWRNALCAFFIALLVGGGYATYLLISGKSKKGEHIAFGPYLCLGIAIALFWGTEIIRFYLNLFI